MSAQPPVAVDIVDARARRAAATDPLRDDILAGLTGSRPAGERTLPTMLLYDERGLRLYDAITTDAPEYYLFAAEEEILRRHGDHIARYMHAGRAAKIVNETVVELGAG